MQFCCISGKILREIKVGESRVSNSAILTHVDTKNFDFYEYLHYLPNQQNPLSLKWPKQQFHDSLKLDFTQNISNRKILKFSHF